MAKQDRRLHRLSDYEWINLKVKAVIPHFPLTLGTSRGFCAAACLAYTGPTRIPDLRVEAGRRQPGTRSWSSSWAVTLTAARS